MTWLSNERLKKVNLALSALVVILGLYIAIIPFWPHVQFWVASLFDNTNGVVYRGDLAGDNDDSNLKEPPEGNQLVVPKMLVDDEIIVGSDPSNIHRGVWHRPNTSTPDQGGNTVFVGHRFSYSDPAVFYHLDKVEVGDQFAVWWEGTEYVYEVYSAATVPATAIEYEGTSDEPIVTLYTCTPLWTARDRLVVQAKLVNPKVLEEKQT